MVVALLILYILNTEQLSSFPAITWLGVAIKLSGFSPYTASDDVATTFREESNFLIASP